MEAIDLKQTQRAWDSIAEGYDQYITPLNEQNVTNKIFKLSGLEQGMRFLDVAAGSGALSIPAARIGVKVTAVDISPAMIRLMEKRAAKEGLRNISGYVMDGHALDLPENSFDVTGSQFGVMLFPDLPKGLREMVRVTKPGGTVMVITFSTIDRVDFIKYFFNALQIVTPDLEGMLQDPPPLPFQVSDPQILHQRMEESGLRYIRIFHEIEQFECKSGIELWNSVMNSNPIALQLTAGLSGKQKIQAQQILEDKIRAQAGGNAYAVLNAALNVAVGKKQV